MRRVLYDRGQDQSCPLPLSVFDPAVIAAVTEKRRRQSGHFVSTGERPVSSVRLGLVPLRALDRECSLAQSGDPLLIAVFSALLGFQFFRLNVSNDAAASLAFVGGPVKPVTVTEIKIVRLCGFSSERMFRI